MSRVYRAPTVADLPESRTVALELLRVLSSHGELSRRQLCEVHGLPSNPTDIWLKRLQLLGFIEARQGERAPGATGVAPMVFRLAPRWRGEGAA